MSFLRYALVLLASHAGLAAAETRTWPGAAPCNGTLQGCVDAAADGDRIQIATDSPLTQSIQMHGRRLTLTAADGFHPRFVGAGVSADNDASGGDIELRLRRLRFESGWVTVGYFGSGTATVDLRELELTRPPGTTGDGVQIRAGGGTVEATLYDNRIHGLPPSANSGMIQLDALAGTMNVAAYYNRVVSSVAGSTDGAGILMDYSNPATGTVKLHANEVRGSFGRAGIFVSEGLYSSTGATYAARLYSNVVVGNGLGSGIGLAPRNGRIDAQLVNNTVTRVRTGVVGTNWDGATTPRIDGLIKNNLLRGERALFLNPGFGATLENDYNLFDGATVNVVPGAHTISAPAALVSDENPRLRADSPAIDAADTGTLGFGLIFNRLPVTDADGLRRIKNPSASGPDKADVGAYEFGDLSFVHSTGAANIGGHISTIDDPASNGRPDADLFLTPNFDGGDNPTVAFNRPYGLWYTSSRWTVFDQGFAAMPADVDFDAFVPAAGSGVFRHVADAANSSGWSSQLDDGSLNDLPDRIVLVAQNWSAGSVYNAHPVGVFYFSFGGPGAWLIANLDMTDDLPIGAGFNVYAQEPSPNAFRVTAGAANTLGSGLLLDHPLLNGTPCAQPMVTRLFDANPVAGHFDVDYADADRRWRIFSYGGMPAGTQFHVLVNPAQVAACSDRLFADGFD